MLPDAFKESMAGAGVDDDEAPGTEDNTDVVADRLDNDGVMSDSLQEVGEVAPLASADDTSFPEDNDTRTAWDDDRPSRSAAIAAQMAQNNTPEDQKTGGSGGKAAWVASLLYLLALGGGGAYVAYVAEAPPPVNDGSAVRVISPIEGEVAVAPAVEPGPTPDDPGTDPVVVTELPEPPDPIEPTPIEPSNVPDTVVVAPTPEPVAPAVEQPRTIVRAEGTPPQEPLASLQEPSEFGPLPIVFGNGRPHQVYARRVPIIDAPRIALVMTDLGLDQTRTQVAIERLPADVSLAFHAYAPGLDDWIAAARNDGHESLLAVPMEPIDYPLSDPGPNALLVDNTAEENLTELYKSLGAAEGYVGVTNFMGSALMADFTAIAPVMRELGDRGLLFIDDNTAINSVAPEVSARFPMPFARANRIIDSLPTPADIDEQLAGLEALAKINGAAIGFMQSYPITLQRLEEWLPLLNSRGIDLVPVSAVAQFGGGITEQAQQAEAADREPASEATNSDG